MLLIETGEPDMLRLWTLLVVVLFVCQLLWPVALSYLLFQDDRYIRPVFVALTFGALYGISPI